MGLGYFVSLNFFQFLNLLSEVAFTVRTIQSKYCTFHLKTLPLRNILIKKKNVLNAEYEMFFQQAFASKIKICSLYLPIIVKMQNIFRLIS